MLEECIEEVLGYGSPSFEKPAMAYIIYKKTGTINGLSFQIGEKGSVNF